MKREHCGKFNIYISTYVYTVFEKSNAITVDGIQPLYFEVWTRKYINIYNYNKIVHYKFFIINPTNDMTNKPRLFQEHVVSLTPIVINKRFAIFFFFFLIDHVEPRHHVRLPRDTIGTRGTMTD